MAEPTSPGNEAPESPVNAREAGLEPVDPRLAYRSALGRYSAPLLASIVQARGLDTEASRPSNLAMELAEQLDSPSAVARQLTGLGPGPCLALGLFALTETTVGSVAGLAHALAILGMEAHESLILLLGRGLLAIDAGPDAPPLDDLRRGLEQGPPTSVLLRVYPVVPRVVRVPLPEGPLAATTTQVAQVRESDGLEPIVRLSAVWQRVGVEPLRQTQQGTLYKRDHERIEEDPVFSDAVTDAPAPLPNLPSLWLALALRLGLVRHDPSGDRLEAAPSEFWAENAVHLPQMIATSWLGLRSWREQMPGPGDPPDFGLPAAWLRPVALLWLARLGGDEWLALDDLAALLRSLNPRWDRSSFRDESDGAGSTGRRPRTRVASADPGSKDVLRPLLLGAGYTMGLVRVALEKVGSRPVVQLTPLGRYVLAMGPPPAPRPSFEHFLFVQPNLEIVAYRQGITPQLVGHLSRFAWWNKLGAALELKLTKESILFGLDGGLSPESMLELLTRHSQRPLPTLVPDAITRWTERREQVSFYTAATLIEFGSATDRDQALAEWALADPGTFVPVAERYLLVENPKKIPTDRIRSGGSRDYRHPPEKCVRVEPDGITLVLDPLRSDLLIDAELARIADELPASQPSSRVGRTAQPERKYVVTAVSLRRAGAMGIPASQIVEWFQQRTGEGPSSAIRLLLRAAAGTTSPLCARRVLILAAPTPELADGLHQHPETLSLLGERLGPMVIAIPEENVEALRRVLEQFGLQLSLE
jgi:hypothetical protein